MRSPSPPPALAPVPKEPPSPDELRGLVPRRAVYNPTHVAADLGVSHDCVIKAIKKRPKRFPPSEPGLKRRREWASLEAYIEVLWVLCSVSPYASRAAHGRIANARQKTGG